MSFVPYCATYHCAGDCGLPHTQQERHRQFTAAGRARERKRLTLAAFDRLAHEDEQTKALKRSEIERAARNRI